MGSYQRFAVLVAIMVAVALGVGGTAIAVLYNAMMETQRERLVETVRSQARLMEAVARFDELHTVYPDGARSATLAQIDAAHHAFHEQHPKENLRLWLGRRTNGGIFIHIDGEGTSDDFFADLAAAHPQPAAAHASSSEAASVAPMRLAMAGHAGTMLARNSDGSRSLVAFEPVAVLDLGIVAEMPLRELNRPFFAAGIAVGAITLFLTSIGTLLYFPVGAPVILKLRENEGLYQRLFEQSPSPQFILDPEFQQFVSVNDALLRLCGYTRHELQRLPLSRLEARATQEELRAHILQILQQRTREFETLWRTKPGGILTVSVNACVVEVCGRTAIHCVMTDLTERAAAAQRVRDLQDQLQRATRANELGQIASELTHEMKQPLTAALNYINACRRFLQAPDAPARERAAIASAKAADQITRADHVIRGLRSYIQHKDPVRVPEDLNVVVAEAVELATASAGSVQIKMRLADGLPPVRIDRVQIQQVLLNLLRNAVEAVAPSATPTVCIDTRPGRGEAADPPSGADRDGDEVEITVADSGPGIAPDVAERMFQPFVTTKPDGLGVGLAFSLGIIRSHGGSLTAGSASGGGAVFHIRLPANRAAGQEADASAAA